MTLLRRGPKDPESSSAPSAGVHGQEFPGEMKEVLLGPRAERSLRQREACRATEKAGQGGRPGARATGSYHPDPLATPKGEKPA